MPTEQSRKTLLILRGLGWSHELVGVALRIDPKTLRRHYFPELRLRRHEARERLAVENVVRIHRRATEGSLLAMRLMRQLIEQVSVGGSIAAGGASGGLGKKATAAIAATSAGCGSEWAIPVTRTM
jgi:hypothetical protein